MTILMQEANNNFAILASVSDGQARRLRLSGIPLLDLIATPAAAAYSQARRLRDGYTGALTRVRRSADNLEKPVSFTTNTQTRTNLALVPANNNTGSSVAGVTMTIIGTGTEFNLPYVETRWQGTATAAGSLVYNHSFAGPFDPALHAPVTSGLTYSSSVGYRLVAGTAPPGQILVRGSWRNSAGTFLGAALLTALAPTATMQRGAAIGAAPIGVTYCQPGMVFNVALNEVVDFTARFYAPNVEFGIGNARPMLTRGVPEVIAAPNDLDAEVLLLHCSGINQLTWSEQFDNAVWPITNATVTANTTLAPDGTLTADTLTENAALTQHRFARTTASLTAGQEWTDTIYVKRGVGSRQFQLGLSGGGLVAKAYFDLGAGAVGFTDQCTATITPAADGYYRVSLTATITTTVVHSLFLAMANGTTNGSETYTGDGVSSLVIWGNQFSPGAILPYVIAEGTALTGVGSGFEAVGYDQSGNGRNKIQTTAASQLALVTNGAINTQNQRPTARADGIDDFMDIAAPIGLGCVSVVLSNFDGAAFGDFDGILGGQSVANWVALGSTASVRAVNNIGTPRVNGVSTTNFAPLEELKVLSTNNSVTVAEATGWRLAQDRGLVARRWNGNFSEVIAFETILPDVELQTVERNQGAYFGVSVA